MVPNYLYSTYLLVTLLALCADAAPASNSYTLSRRASAPFDGPKTIQTHHVIAVPGGSVVEDCVVTLTPVVVDGLNFVREERKCTNLFVKEGDDIPPPPDNGAGNQTPPPDETDTTPPPEETTPPPESTDAPPPADTTTSAPPAESTTPPAEPPTNTEDSGTLPPSPTDPPAGGETPAEPPAGGQDPANPAGDEGTPGSPPTDGAAGDDPAVVLGPTDVPAQNQNADPSGTRANDGAPTQSNVQIPGKKLEVLPIGLGVFAGISVIALIVVGLVTYERTKYRKAFRQRRLAAAGAEMGYGGMAERR